ncbi:MAG: hypothetical protein M1838_004851 [Thelocarpon superellum]|nr:MAG: hypothetical protein M1838_004851 [Thelocarpon superellum]
MASSPHDEGKVELCSLNTIHAFPTNFFVENIAVRHTGELLVTVYSAKELFQLDPLGSTPPVLVHQFSKDISGIVELGHDKFYVSTGSIGSAGTFEIVEVDVSTLTTDAAGHVTTPATVRTVVDVPEAIFLNGSTPLPGSEGVFLAADSILGAIFQIDITSGKAKIWLQDEAFTKTTENPFIPGANGIKSHGKHVYVSNTERLIVLRVPISPTGEPGGPVETVFDRCGADDFALDAAGTLYLATHVFNSVIKISPDGVRSRIAGGPDDTTVAGSTSAAFGRTERDRTRLYVTTNGGMSSPVDGKVGPGRVLGLEVGPPGAVA